MWGAQCAGRWVAFASSRAPQRVATAAPRLGLAVCGAGAGHVLVGAQPAFLQCDAVQCTRKQIGIEPGYRMNRDQEDAVKQTLGEMNKNECEPLASEARFPSEQGAPKTTAFHMQNAIGAFAPAGKDATQEQPPSSAPVAQWPPPEALRSDPKFMLKAVRRDGGALKYASSELQKDRALVLEAVRQSGHALEFAAPELRRDRELVLEAVKQNGLALQFAGEALRADRECVLEAIRESGWAMQYASRELQEDAQLAADGGMGWKTGGY